MQIKRRLNAIAKRITPFAESMNQAKEMNRMCKRFEDMLDYAEAKEEKHKAREKTGESMGVRIARERREREANIAKVHAEEAEAMMEDQEQQKLQPESAPEEEPEAEENAG